MNTGIVDMANTSLTLGRRWELFIKNEVASGKYGSASEVVRDALRHMEEHQSKLNALRTHLAIGAEQVARGEFSTKTKEEILTEAKKKYATT